MKSGNQKSELLMVWMTLDVAKAVAVVGTVAIGRRKWYRLMVSRNVKLGVTGRSETVVVISLM